MTDSVRRLVDRACNQLDAEQQAELAAELLNLSLNLDTGWDAFWGNLDDATRIMLAEKLNDMDDDDDNEVWDDLFDDDPELN